MSFLSHHSLSSVENSLLYLLQSCISITHLKQVQARLTTLPTSPHPSLIRVLLKSFIAAGDLLSARRLFDHLPHRTTPSIHIYNILLQALSKSQHPLESIRLFRRLRLSGVAPDKYTFTFVVASCAREFAAAHETGQTTHVLALKYGVCSNVYVGNSLINYYAVLKMVDDARKMFEDMPMRDVVSWTSLIRGHLKNGYVDDARKLFDEMPEPNDFTWAVMIGGYVEAERYDDAIHLFDDMLQVSDERPNEAVFVCVLSACASLGALDQGKWIHMYIDRCKVQATPNISNALIDMYAKCGRIDYARQVFRNAPKRDVYTWTSMVSGLALHGLGDDALKLFREMIAEGVAPDEITLVGMLNACTHSGLVDEGCSLFYTMSHFWGITPEIEHYGCLIDLLGRAGQLEKALAIVLKMPIEPDVVIWRSLLSSSRIHGKLDLCESILNHIRWRDQRSRGCEQVLLSVLYASAGRWEEATTTGSKISHGLNPGCSWIEVGGTIHKFLAADCVHPRIRDVKNQLSQILRIVV